MSVLPVTVEKILVAYKTRVNPALPPDLSNLTPPANYKDKDKIAQWCVDETARRQAAAAGEPYTGTFDEVRIVMPRGKSRKEKFLYRAPNSGRQPISQAVAAYLLAAYPDPAVWTKEGVMTSAYSNEPNGILRAIVVAFDPRTFVKLLGLECGYLPAGSNSPLVPPSLWYENSNHRNFEEIVRPKEDCKCSTMQTVIKAHGLSGFDKWTGPGVDLELDLLLMTELMTRLNMPLID